jgi:acetyl-CoA carboxylase / biotin carboxylase 1
MLFYCFHKEYIRMADHCIQVPGGSNNNNYANCDLILDIAKRFPVQVCKWKL